MNFGFCKKWRWIPLTSVTVEQRSSRASASGQTDTHISDHPKNFSRVVHVSFFCTMSTEQGQAANSPGDPQGSSQESHVEGLRRLALSLREMDAASTFSLSHYRQLPEAISQARELLQAGATLVRGTATKYTLLGKIDLNEQIKMTQDLMKGCQFVATGCVLIHEPSLGCSRAFRRHVKQASRAIVETVIQLMTAFLDETALQEETAAAQKTGIAWQACDVILEKKLPMGNRNAIRRDLFTYMMECQETMEEFQQLVELGPASPRENTEELSPINENGKDNTEEDTNEAAKNEDNNAAWERFLSGHDQQYTAAEIPVATACLTIVKCSRGSINLTLQTCEAVAAQVQEKEPKQSLSDKARLEWLERLYQLACKVGDGMTDFGTNLYPPLDLQTLPQDIEAQSVNCISPLLDAVLDGCTLEDGSKAELPEDVVTLASKLKAAIQNRRQEALDSVVVASGSEAAEVTDSVNTSGEIAS